MSKTRSYIELLASFTVDEQNKVLKISKDNALVILKEIDAIAIILEQNNEQKVLLDLERFDFYTHARFSVNIKKISWNTQIANKFQYYFTKLINFKNENLLEKTLVCKVENSDVNNDNILLNLPKEIQNHIMSFIDISDVQPDQSSFNIPDIANDNAVILGAEEYVASKCCITS